MRKWVTIAAVEVLQENEEILSQIVSAGSLQYPTM